MVEYVLLISSLLCWWFSGNEICSSGFSYELRIRRDLVALSRHDSNLLALRDGTYFRVSLCNVFFPENCSEIIPLQLIGVSTHYVFWLLGPLFTSFAIIASAHQAFFLMSMSKIFYFLRQKKKRVNQNSR